MKLYSCYHTGLYGIFSKKLSSPLNRVLQKAVIRARNSVVPNSYVASKLLKENSSADYLNIRSNFLQYIAE